ncbi:MAG: DEAD/DEAH box helicase [Microbacterium pygmaeum]
MPTFSDLGVPTALANSLASEGKTEAFPIQRDTLPDSLAGRDVLGRGRTGSGKTIAFALPLVARLSGAFASGRTPGRPRGLVLAPTRELATQIAATIQPLAAASGLTVTTIFGGVSQKPQESALRAGVDIVVACPGRLEDLMKQGHIRLDRVEITVLDEADHMADLGFLPGVTRILAATPQGGQRMLFSATLDRGVDTLVRRFLQNEVRHEIDDQSVPQGEMTHRVFLISDDDKAALVKHLASGRGRRIMFTRTKHQAKKLAKVLTAAGIPAVDLHGNLSQAARERNLAAFGADVAKGGVRVLVATDVAARGVHVDEVELVVHVDPPMEHKAYLHRSGRTARAGAAGTVVTVTIPSQRRDVADLLKKAGITAPLEQVTAHAASITELVGQPADHVTPAPIQAAPQRTAKPRTAGAGGQGGSGRGGQGGRGGSTGGRGQGGARGGQGSRDGQAGSGRSGKASGSSSHSRGAAAPAAGSRPFYSTGTGQAGAHNPGAGQTERPRGPRRASHNGQRSGAPRG